MNNILLKICPEPISNLIIRFNIHPVADLFVKAKHNQILKEPRRLLKLYETKLRLLKIMINSWTYVSSYIAPQYPTMIHKNLCMSILTYSIII